MVRSGRRLPARLGSFRRSATGAAYQGKTYFQDDLVVVLLEETFTPAERTLIERGESQGIQDIRRRFQQAMRDEFVSVIEQATGRRVRSFLSETDLEQDVSVEVFLLAEERTDMSAFEPDLETTER